MPTASSPDRYVTLRAGLVLPVEPLRLAWALEDRGFRLAVEEGALVVRPGSALTADDRAAIRRWKSHLFAIAQYCEAPDLGAHLRGVQ